MYASNEIRSAASRLTPVPLAIIGGGAAGLFAASVASAAGLGCLLFERKARPGSKMLMTANGRCNFTKDISPEQMLSDIGEPVASFLRAAITACPPARIAGGFRSLGVRIRRMADGRLFPASEKAADIVHAFGDVLRDRETPIMVNAAATGIRPSRDGFEVSTRFFSIPARNVLVATGGMSFPKTGSVGDGQSFARALGHRIEPCRAGLTGFEARVPPPARHETASARIVSNGRAMCEFGGEVEFERWGVSGAAVYNCQRWAARHLREGSPFTLELSLPGGRLRLDSPRPRPLKEAIVTIGGVSRDDVDPATMMSRIVPGLYFAGEVLDIDGPTGGYNLSMAFATARLAVASILASRRR
jgi:predicted Rossmann fold flavoprotein